MREKIIVVIISATFLPNMENICFEGRLISSEKKKYIDMSRAINNQIRFFFEEEEKNTHNRTRKQFSKVEGYLKSTTSRITTLRHLPGENEKREKTNYNLNRKQTDIHKYYEA